MSKETQRLYDIILGARNGKPIEDFDPPLKAKEIEFYNSVLEDCARIRAEGREPMFELPVDYEADYEKDEDNEPGEIADNKEEQDKDTQPMECMLAMLKMFDGIRIYRLT